MYIIEYSWRFRTQYFSHKRKKDQNILAVASKNNVCSTNTFQQYYYPAKAGLVMVFPQITKTSSTKSRVIAKKRTIVLSLQKMKILQWKYLYFLYIIVKGIFVNIRMRSSVATKLCKKCTRISSEMRWLYYPILHFNVQYRTLFFLFYNIRS